MDSVSVKSENVGAYLKLKTRVAEIDLSSEGGTSRLSNIGKELNTSSMFDKINETST